MKKPMILQLLPMYHSDGEKELQSLAEVFIIKEFNQEKVIKFLKEHPVDGIILRAPATITPEILDHCYNVKAISGAGVGLDNIDVKYAIKKGIKVLHAPSLNSQATAEHTVGLIMAVMKQIPLFNEEIKKGRYSIRDSVYPIELAGKQAGLIGFGQIAQKTAKILSAGFEMKVTAYVRKITTDRIKLAELLNINLTTSIEEVFKYSDVVSLHIPLTKETERMIDKTLLSLMKKESSLIKTARGGLICEEDLISVLERKLIKGAALDVFTIEPPPINHPFFSLENVVTTPHIGGISLEAAKKTSVLIARNLVHVLNGGTVPTIVK